MRRFTPVELQAYLAQNAKPPLLLDVREPWEYHICQLSGSQLIPMREIPQAVEDGDLDPAQEIVAICHHGIRSRQVAYYLEQQGFDKVINLEGGVEAWANEIDPAMPHY
jgi:rhodanese-related sulfurtransferase